MRSCHACLHVFEREKRVKRCIQKRERAILNYRSNGSRRQRWRSTQQARVPERLLWPASPLSNRGLLRRCLAPLLRDSGQAPENSKRQKGATSGKCTRRPSLSPANVPTKTQRLPLAQPNRRPEQGSGGQRGKERPTLDQPRTTDTGFFPFVAVQRPWGLF